MGSLGFRWLKISTYMKVNAKLLVLVSIICLPHPWQARVHPISLLHVPFVLIGGGSVQYGVMLV